MIPAERGVVWLFVSGNLSLRRWRLSRLPLPPISSQRPCVTANGRQGAGRRVRLGHHNRRRNSGASPRGRVRRARFTAWAVSRSLISASPAIRRSFSAPATVLGFRCLILASSRLDRSGRCPGRVTSIRGAHSMVSPTSIGRCSLGSMRNIGRRLGYASVPRPAKVSAAKPARPAICMWMLSFRLGSSDCQADRASRCNRPMPYRLISASPPRRPLPPDCRPIMPAAACTRTAPAGRLSISSINIGRCTALSNMSASPARPPIHRW